MISSDEFITKLVAQFPEFREVLDGSKLGLIHVQMGHLARLTRQAIELGRFGILEELFAFLGASFAEADSALENAFLVSYLEHLEFKTAYEKIAWDLMPVSLQAGWHKIDTSITEHLTPKPSVKGQKVKPRTQTRGSCERKNRNGRSR